MVPAGDRGAGREEMKSISFTNFKGGVGKTTTAVNVGACMAELHPDRKILIVDFDPQANATFLMMQPDLYEANFQRKKRTIYDLIYRMADAQSYQLSDYIAKDCLTDRFNQSQRPNLHLMPGSPYMMAVDYKKHSMSLSKLLAQCADYDVVIVDTPPAIGLSVLALINAVDYYVIPTIPDYISSIGIHRMIELFCGRLEGEDFRLPKAFQRFPVLLGVVFSKVDDLIVHNDYRETIESEFEAGAHAPYSRVHVFSTVIKDRKDVLEASRANKPVFLFNRKSDSAAQYFNLTREIVAKLQTAHPGSI